MDLDVLLAPVPEKGYAGPCKVGRIVDSLEDPYRSALITLLNSDVPDGGMSAEQLQTRMAQAGLKVGASAIRRHRARGCSCESLVIG
jgi:hypothetical protein